MGSIVGNPPDATPEQAQLPKEQKEVEDGELYQDVVSQFPFLNGHT